MISFSDGYSQPRWVDLAFFNVLLIKKFMLPQDNSRPWPLVSLKSRFSDSAHKAEFDNLLHQTTARRGLQLALAVLGIQFFYLFAFDYAGYAKGYWSEYNRVFMWVFVWRLASIGGLGAYALWYVMTKDRRTPQVARAQAWTSVFITLALGTSFGVICQLLMPDYSIIALGFFATAGLLPMPSRLKLLAYPACVIVVSAATHSIELDPLVWRGLSINAFSVMAVAIFVDSVCVQAELDKYLASQEIARQKQRSDDLLYKALPGPVADRLKQSESRIVDYFGDVTVLFADLVGFTGLTTRMAPRDLIEFLERVFGQFDDTAHRFGAERIKTIGDQYMAVCGAPIPVEDHAERVAAMALEMLQSIRLLSRKLDIPLQLRIGIHTGPAIAGVLGQHRLAYDLWGETINLASRMESHGLPDRIHVTEQVFHRLKSQFHFEPRGQVSVKGLTCMNTWFLTGASATRS